MKMIMRVGINEVCAPAYSKIPEYLRDFQNDLAGDSGPRERAGSNGYVVNRPYLEESRDATEVVFDHGELLTRFLKAHYEAQKYFVRYVQKFMQEHELDYLEIGIRWSSHVTRFMMVSLEKVRIRFDLL